MNDKIELLQTAYEYITRLEEGIEVCIECFQTGDFGKANRDLVLIIDGLDWLIRAITLTKEIQSKPIDLSSITTALPELLDGIENSDNILIADILQYEILEGLQTWQNEIQCSLANE